MKSTEVIQEGLAGLDGVELLSKAIEEVFPQRICVVSAFGSESAVLLDLVARIDRQVPVLFIDTGKHFPETLAYRDLLTERLSLTSIHNAGPAADHIAADPDGTRHQYDPDGCCAVRKVAPLDQALSRFDCWITGRKRFQGGLRSDLPAVELDKAGRFKLNPLADWTSDQIDAYFENFGLPRHPLWFNGYRSIGCAPCSACVEESMPSRTGRWQGSSKTECGIHNYGKRAAERAA